MRREDLIHWEDLAKLSLTEAERERFFGDLNDLLAFCSPLGEFPDKEALCEPSPKTREDIPAPCLGREEILAEAPSHADGLITVPKSL